MQLALQLQDSAPLDDLARLCRLLRDRTGWTTAATIQTRLNLPERKTRALASQSQGLIVSGPGSPGYKHVANCTGQEIDKICGKLQAQAKIMSSRAGQIRAQFHKTDKNS